MNTFQVDVHHDGWTSRVTCDNVRYGGNGITLELDGKVVYHALTYQSWRKLFPVKVDPLVTTRMRCGLKLQWGGLWVGAHYSTHNRRWCINLLPCVTLWIALKGGKVPR